MFIVIEMQTNNGATTVVTPIKTFTDINEAYEEYYRILMYAAVSKLEVHTAMILTETGKVVASEHFAHETKAETEVTEE